MGSLKKSLKDSSLTVGSWITLADQSLTEIMASSGFDWLAIDMEHSAITISEAQKLIRVIALSGVTPLVRVGGNNPYFIKQAMDAGSHGVIVPMVNSRKEAIDAVDAVKYPPYGKRGVGLARAQGYGLDFNGYRLWQQKNSVVIAQIEHIDAVNNLEDILGVDGIDGSIIGPYDLSASLGYPGEFNRKEVAEAIARYKKVCKSLRKPAGFHVIPPDAGAVNRKIKEGFKFVALSLDTLFIGEKIRTEMKGLKK